MALMAPVEDGKIVTTESQNSLKKNNATGMQSGMDKDAFLQLLVAQMQYQDPLEPTSNTEYISQYAQFSQVEQMQNMAASSDLARASSLVGKEVYIRTTNAAGDTGYKQGRVDYVVFENGKAKLSIEEKLYALEDLDTVLDETYFDAYKKAEEFTIGMNKLPILAAVDLTDADAIDKLENTFNEMSDYEKTFITKENKDKLAKYIEKLKEVRLAAGEADGAEKPEEPDGTEKPGDGENTDGTEKPEEPGGTEKPDESGGTENGGA